MSPALKRLFFYAPLLLLGAMVLYRFLVVALSRMAYPYELEWMEGGVLQQVLRVLEGQPLYGDASLDFIPALYMPLYYYVAALTCKIFGAGFFSLRLVSFVATLITHGLAFLIVWRVARSWLAGMLAMLFYSFMFCPTAFWFDVARVDSLWTMFLALAFYVVVRCRDHTTTGHLVLLASVSVLAFFTKQATLFLLPFFSVAFVCWCGWRVFGKLMLLNLLFFLSVFLLLFFFAGDNFVFYTLQMAGTHGVSFLGIKKFFSIVAMDVPVFVLVALVGLFLSAEKWRVRLGWIALLVGFLFLSLLSRAYAGAFFNVLMPFYFALSVFAALGVAALVERIVASWRHFIVVIPLLILLAMNMSGSSYDVRIQIPSKSSHLAGDGLVSRIAQTPGNVCVVSHGYLAWMAGKSFCAHNTQVTDLVTGSSKEMADSFLQSARQRILSGYYSAILLDREKELQDLGLQLADIPYTASIIDYPQGEMVFPVNGHSPKIWLQFNGASATAP